jgi:hypothetical protein
MPFFARWLVDAIAIDSALEANFEEAHVRLANVVSAGLEYLSPANQPFHDITGRTVDCRDGSKPKLLSGVTLTREEIGILVRHNALPRVQHRAFVYANRLAVLRLLGAMRDGFGRDDLFVPLIAFRTILENVGQLLLLNRETTRVPDATDFDTANRAQEGFSGAISKIALGTRIDWDRALTSEMSGSATDIAYAPDPSRADRLSASVLKAVDLVDREIAGTRRLYEILCEFSHPNVGVMLSASRSHDVIKRGSDGAIFHRKSLGVGAPLGFIAQVPSFLLQAFRMLGKTLEIHCQAAAVADAENGRILATTQTIIRRLLRAQPFLMEPYELCPCGSAAKTKFCCGRT